MILPPVAAARFNVLQFMYPLQWSASGSLERSRRAFLISGTQASDAYVRCGSLADINLDERRAVRLLQGRSFFRLSARSVSVLP